MNWTSVKRTVRHAAIAAVILPAFAVQAQAPAPKPAAAPAPTQQQFGSWQLVCQAPSPGAPEICEIRQVARNDKKQPIAGLFLVKHDDGMGMRVHVPLGVLLRKNPTLQVDSGASTDGLSYLRCGRSICIARMDVAETFLAAMRRGKEATLTFYVNETKPITVKFALAGLADAEAAFKGKTR